MNAFAGEQKLCRVAIDVTGMSMTLPRLLVESQGTSYDFVLDAKLKHGMGFHCGAFFSKSVLTDEVFRYPRSRRVAVLTESPIDACYRRIDEVVRRFPLIFTHQHELLDRGAPFLPLMFGTNWLGVRDPDPTDAVIDAREQKSHMVSFIGSLQHPDEGAYRMRRQVAEYVLARGDVDCFGKGIRPISGKREAIGPYRFSIAMENAAADHYFSEKLVDCLLLETVPIYYGCPGIVDLLDPRGLLRFQSLEELVEVLDGLSPELYAQMRPYVMENKQKVVLERWHNHTGMFERLAESLPKPMRLTTPRPYGSDSRLTRAWRRFGFPGT